ncbi:hypothetical protein FRC19_003462, partial [Serendipita sp. 401]
IIAYGPKSLNLALCIPQLHYGALKYIPSLRVPRSLMALFVECQINLAHRLAARDTLEKTPEAKNREKRIE